MYVVCCANLGGLYLPCENKMSFPRKRESAMLIEISTTKDENGLALVF